MALAVPVLESLAGATKTIYLDFDGHITQNTNWNSYFNQSTITSPAYNTDGDASNFSDSELADIQDAWKRIAEDFMPFGVNVTTKDPGVDALRNTGGTDSQWGVRAVITTDNVGCDCGGIAYVGSFTWNSDTPVFIYNTSGKYVAEAASHEVGHSLGLSHDGTSSSSYYEGHGSGTTSWAPIMGVGYYPNVTQWDKGEYYGANNKQDDLAIITANNGFGYRADDYGDTTGTATVLTSGGSSISASGLISRTADVDVFSLTVDAGPATINIAPAALGANLDIKAELLDSSGNVVATSSPTDILSASFDLTLSAGVYYLRIDGTGVGTPTANPPTGYTEYGSLGQYSISGTITPSTATILSVAASSADQVEGNSGSTPFTFTVTRTGDTSAATSVDYAIAGSGSAAAGADDWATGAVLSGTLTFDVGVSSLTISVDVAGDTTVESDETFTVTLSNPGASAILGTASATGTIRNDDSPPPTPTITISKADASKSEGTNTTTPTNYTFTVTRSGDATPPVSVKYTITGVGGSKAAASDFWGGVLPSGTILFEAGQTSKTLIIQVAADAAPEKNEGFRVSLSSPIGGALGTAKTADGSIVNDDKAINGKLPKPGAVVIPLPVREPLPGAEGAEDDHDHHGPSCADHGSAGHNNASGVQGLLVSNHNSSSTSPSSSLGNQGSSVAVVRSSTGAAWDAVALPSAMDDDLLEKLSSHQVRNRRSVRSHAANGGSNVDQVFANWKSEGNLLP